MIELQQYANKYQLPHRRNELLMAQIAAYIARTMGGADPAPLEDYMPYRQPAEELDFDDMTPEQIREYYKFEVST